ncbi:MAG: 30S ribosomal protein S4 [Candidatus Ancillula sp.]|jgi:small subunit ribosomal protein S4|nr:30S ribosomal protein S4 [Candidatus Ancillula sp.]
MAGTSIKKSRRQVRLSRALGLALTPKAQKHFDRRPYAPGEHGRSGRGKDSDYKIRLKEKQRLRAQYALREKQLRAAYNHAKTRPGLTGEVMIEFLETRLDALVLRAGFARTIQQARQIVVHGHLLVDGVKLDRPSAKVKPGQTVQVRPKSQPLAPFFVAATGAHRDVLPDVPAYLDVQLTKLQFKLERAPKRSEVPVTCEENLVVEYYAR